MVLFPLACVAPEKAGELGGPDATEVLTGGGTETGTPAPEPPFAHLPVLQLAMEGPIGDGTATPGILRILVDHDGTLTDLDAAPVAWTGAVGVVVQGASSAGYPKQNFHLELRDEAGDDDDAALLGLGSDSDYVLAGGYGDKTYVRNALAYGIASDLAPDVWQPGFQFVELFVDGAYRGIYMLTERVKRDADKLDLPAPAPDASGDLTGGYVFKIDHCRGPCFTTALGTPLEYLDPGTDEITSGQDGYVQSWFASFESMLVGDGYTDPATGYPAWIDVDSFVDHVLVQELAHNVDAYTLSTYPFKARDTDGGRLHAGPVWDFDRAFGNVNYCGCWNTYGWIVDDLAVCGYPDFPVIWYRRLLGGPGFQARMRCRWDELRAGVLADAAMVDRLRGLWTTLAEAQPRDEAVWQTIGVNTGVNWYVGATWEEEQGWLESWVVERAAWMDGALPGSCDG